MIFITDSVADSAEGPSSSMAQGRFGPSTLAYTDHNNGTVTVAVGTHLAGKHPLQITLSAAQMSRGYCCSLLVAVCRSPGFFDDFWLSDLFRILSALDGWLLERFWIFGSALRAGVQISNTPTPEIDVCASESAQR